MVIVAVVCAALLVGVLGGIVYRRCKARQLPDASIHLCIPFAEPVLFGTEDVTREYEAIWGKEVACERATEPSAAVDGAPTYVVRARGHSLRLIASPSSLRPDLTETAIQGVPDLDASAIDALRQHRGHIMLSYLSGLDRPRERAAFCAEVLFTLLKKHGALGYVDIPAMLYRSKTGADSSLAREELLDDVELFFLLVNTHSVDMETSFWIHTHGMEQFGCPDLQVSFRDEDQHSYYRDLISNAAAYMIERGPILKPGHTAELAGDGIIYRIKPVKPDRDHPFGRYGAIELVPD